MARLRYVRDMSKPVGGMQTQALNNTVRSIRAVYETEPEIAAALLPKPMKAIENPEIFIQSAHVAMHVSEEQTIEIGAVTAAVRCTYEGRPGGYVLGMWMPGEFVCVKGRERFGEPKKQAVVNFTVEGNKFDTSVVRHDIPFIQMTGEIGEKNDNPLEFEEHFFCHKAFLDITGGDNLDGTVLMTQLNWKRNYTVRHDCTGEIKFRESPNDPIIDVPVKKLVSMEYVEGATQTSGEILQEIPAEWIVPFLHQRYDEPQIEGIDIALASEA